MSKKAKTNARTARDSGGLMQRMVSRLRRRYTRVVKIGDKWNTYLQIDHQGFCVVEQTVRQRAQWYGKMLAISLARMLANAGVDRAVRKTPENLEKPKTPNEAMDHRQPKREHGSGPTPR